MYFFHYLSLLYDMQNLTQTSRYIWDTRFCRRLWRSAPSSGLNSFKIQQLFVKGSLKGIKSSSICRIAPKLHCLWHWSPLFVSWHFSSTWRSQSFSKYLSYTFCTYNAKCIIIWLQWGIPADLAYGRRLGCWCIVKRRCALTFSHHCIFSNVSIFTCIHYAMLLLLTLFTNLFYLKRYHFPRSRLLVAVIYFEVWYILVAAAGSAWNDFVLSNRSLKQSPLRLIQNVKAKDPVCTKKTMIKFPWTAWKR